MLHCQLIDIQIYIQNIPSNKSDSGFGSILKVLVELRDSFTIDEIINSSISNSS
jgi:hypothetical protein